MRGQVDLRVGERLARGDQDLALDQVDVGHDLGDGVLDLDARIDLDEVEARPSRRRPGTRPSRHCHSARGGRAATAASQIACADFRIEVVRRRDLDDLLVPALNRAVALVKMNEVAVPVAQNLHLDVLGLADELLDEDVGNAEGRARLAPRLVERGVERVGRLDHAHAAAAASHRRLDDDREAERLGQRREPPARA